MRLPNTRSRSGDAWPALRSSRPLIDSAGRPIANAVAEHARQHLEETDLKLPPVP
jgi:hypothetical protein